MNHCYIQISLFLFNVENNNSFNHNRLTKTSGHNNNGVDNMRGKEGMDG